MYDAGNPGDHPSSALDSAAPTSSEGAAQPPQQDQPSGSTQAGGPNDSSADSAESAQDLRSRADKLHKHIRQAVLVERRAMREIALGLAELQREKLYRQLGYASLVEYGEQALGFMADKTRQLARIGRCLPDLPVLDRAFGHGIIGWTKARCVVQVATAETERAWVERALQVNSRDLEDLVASTCHGKPPPELEEDWNPPRHVWARFRLDPFHFERLMHVLGLVRRHLGNADLSSSQMLLYLAEQWLECHAEGTPGTGHPDADGAEAREDGRRGPWEGEASQVRPDVVPEPAVQVCSGADKASCSLSAGEPPAACPEGETEPTVHSRSGTDEVPCSCSADEPPAACPEEEPDPPVHVCSGTDEIPCPCSAGEPPATQPDGEPDPPVHVCSDTGEVETRGEQNNTSTRGENAYPVNYRVIEHRCSACERAWLETGLGRIELDERTRALIECDAEIVAGDDSAGTPGHLSRTIPPATRRAVLIRDRGRCTVPGCRHKKHLELHHIEPWAQSRSHRPSILTTVCSAHHTMLHNGVLRVSRGADGDLQWERGAGEPLGVIVSIWGESAELDHASLREFEGPPGSWACIREYWGDIEPPRGLLPAPDAAYEAAQLRDGGSSAGTGEGDEAGSASAIRERYPRGRQCFRLGDEERMGSDWNARFLSSP